MRTPHKVYSTRLSVSTFNLNQSIKGTFWSNRPSPLYYIIPRHTIAPPNERNSTFFPAYQQPIIRVYSTFWRFSYFSPFHNRTSFIKGSLHGIFVSVLCGSEEAGERTVRAMPHERKVFAVIETIARFDNRHDSDGIRQTY